MRLHKDDDTAIVVHRKKRIVWFQGSITKQTGLCVGKALRVLNRNCKKPILFYLFSTGGEVGGERLIVRAIKNSSAPIIMIGHRRIASAALTVFQGGGAAVCSSTHEIQVSSDARNPNRLSETSNAPDECK
jgi:ATP-dependent protease ClpP protease subunit